MQLPFPTHSRVVVIGGGIVGCSVAYHLNKLGIHDVVLVERKNIASGTTWAAAGLMGQLWANGPLTMLAKYGGDLYSRLEQETGQPTGYKRNGSIRVAQTKDRVKEYRRSMAMAHAFGIEMDEIDLSEAKRRWPLLNTDDLLAAWYQPNDAHANPEDTAQALAKGARMNGTRIIENVEALDVTFSNNTVSGVITDKGKIQCEIAVLTGGMWSSGFARKMGITVPLHAAEHMHVATEPMEGVSSGLPDLRDMDGYIYFKEETGGLLMGGFEPVAKPWGKNGIPDDFCHTTLAEDWDQFEIFMKNAIKRVPAMADARVGKLLVVPESFTPDNAYMLGEAPGFTNFFVAAGMNSVGITSAGGAGKALAEWIVQGYPEQDLWAVDIRRFHGWQRNRRYLHDRVKEGVGLLYAHHWPFKQVTTSRPVRCSAFHDRLANMGACFGVLSGWERANWFAPKGTPPKYQYSWDRQNWFEHSAAEHRAVRENVGFYDLSSMAKFRLEGKDALPVLQYICANNVDVAPGRVVYTQLLNQWGGIEADLTVTRLSKNLFFIVTAAATQTRDFDWIKRHIPPFADAVLTDVTSGYSMLAVVGPNSREVLGKLSDEDLSNAAFPFASARELDVAYARPLVLRMNFVGELGYELYIPTEFSLPVFDALMEAGSDFDMKPVGLHAIDSLRLEKGYRHWGSDITPDNSPIEAGLERFVRYDKGDFLGRSALLAQREKGVIRKLVMFTLENPDKLLFHDEPIYRDMDHEAEITHGAYAHFLGCAMGMGYLENPEGITDKWILEGRYEVNVEGERVKAKAHLKPPYDPDNLRLRK